MYDRLRALRDSAQGRARLGVAPEAWDELDTNWQKVDSQLRHWQWLLDTALPGEFGRIGEWLNQGEALVHADDVPQQLNEEAAAVLNQKIEDHKAFFRQVGDQCNLTVGVYKSFIHVYSAFAEVLYSQYVSRRDH